jgi:short-subunit dehydrogenase
MISTWPHAHLFILNLVNCFAQIRMTKAFLPIFKQQAIGRTYGDSQIVNMVSMAGMLSGGGIGLTAYEVSKNAAEAFTDALRLEMKMFGVKVVSVNPSFHSTPLVSDTKKNLKDSWDNMSPDLQKEYGQGRLL